MILLEIASCLLTALLAPFFVFLGLLVLAALLGRAPSLSSTDRRWRFLIVIPAHDEEGVIASTVQSCRALSYPAELFTTWVIADNCTDGTAGAARQAGASVVERQAPDLRSKGHALEYFFSEIPEGRPESGYDAVVLIDADTVVDPGLLDTFGKALNQGQDWVQGYYTVRNPDASWRTRLMTYAFSLANGVWMLGLDRLGLSVGLKGNGMCFSSRGLRRFPWRAYGLVEDMEFALMLRTRGERVHFLPEARVFGEMVSRGGPGAASQRRRWEAGRRALRGKFAGPLARSESIGVYRKTMYLLDLFFPPLVSLALGLAMAFSLALAHLVGNGSGRLVEGLLVAQVAMAILLSAYAISPTVVMGLPLRYLGSLVALPYYAAWKIAVAAGRGPRSWVRTPRESSTSR
ncbi:glycosyltransferase family 2 protein (plasmid) [Tundrisphaera lichenicola]|uniref:glycosyltransferase family 2 protein n=1 Tax=Tundrisphaera lichenicola TaxID=2029860 RepID=UPI003EBC19C8